MRIPKLQAPPPGRSDLVRAKLASRRADRLLAEAECQGQQVEKIVAELRGIRERNHLGQMVSDALKAGEDAKK